MHRFYIPPERWMQNALTLDRSEGHHCINVLRLDVGSRVVVFDGRGLEAAAEIASIENGCVRLHALSSAKSARLRCAITLAQAIPKGKNMDLIIQKATELGVSKIVPLLSERTVVHLANAEAQKKREK